ncbi:MAG: helix-turn-helix transcriptional regulator [Oscillospiraceae bacterium]|nr:helix-turn-helix transcriptional regulator [Oscillospiraceae bacterium]
MINFAEHIRNIRKSKSLTQKEVAEGIGVDECVYQRYENNKAKPSFENIIALADFFDISADYLLGRKEE